MSLHAATLCNAVSKEQNRGSGLSPGKEQGEQGRDEEERAGLTPKGRQSSGGAGGVASASCDGVSKWRKPECSTPPARRGFARTALGRT